MKKLLLSVAVLATLSTSASAWTDQFGHWQEGPAYPGLVPHYAYNPPPYYGHPLPPPYAYGSPYGYGAPVVVVPPPTDAQVIAGTVLGIASMFARGRY